MLTVEIRATRGALELDVRLPPIDGTTMLVGPNGAGKSTLLKCVLGVVRPGDGRIAFDDEAIWDPVRGVEVAPEHRRIGYVPQRYALFTHMTVAENVGFGVRGVSTDERRARIEALLVDLEIGHLVDRTTRSLSGGEAQRVALARALAIRPRAILLDEPMAALDVGARRRVRRFLVERLREIGIPTLVVSHDVDDLEAFDGIIVVIEHGRVVQQGTLEELRAEPATPFVEDFVAREPLVAR